MSPAEVRDSVVDMPGLDELKLDIIVEKPRIYVSAEDREYIRMLKAYPPQWKAVLSDSGK